MLSEAENKLLKMLWGHVYCSPPRSTGSAEIRETNNKTLIFLLSFENFFLHQGPWGELLYTLVGP